MTINDLSLCESMLTIEEAAKRLETHVRDAKRIELAEALAIIEEAARRARQRLAELA